MEGGGGGDEKRVEIEVVCLDDDDEDMVESGASDTGGAGGGPVERTDDWTCIANMGPASPRTGGQQVEEGTLRTEEGENTTLGLPQESLAPPPSPPTSPLIGFEAEGEEEEEEEEEEEVESPHEEEFEEEEVEEDEERPGGAGGGDEGGGGELHKTGQEGMMKQEVMKQEVMKQEEMKQEVMKQEEMNNQMKEEDGMKEEAMKEEEGVMKTELEMKELPLAPVPQQTPPVPPPPAPTKKRKGRKKKMAAEEKFLSLPAELLAGRTPQAADQLQEAYKILQTILRVSMIHPFLEKPNANLFGMSSYYNIIKKPMWLNEVQRKLLDGEYEGICEFVDDLRLMLENCYRFWGPTHKFSRKALFIEHKLELKLSQLPHWMQLSVVESNANNASEVLIKREEVDEAGEETGLSQAANKQVATTLIKGFESKILSRLLESDEVVEDPESLEEQRAREREMLDWEQEHLVTPQDLSVIKSMWQLAEIGTFLKLTHEVLNVEEITQYEVERMLLMPKESTTLATLMTSILSSQVCRSSLDSKAVMPYGIWTFRLKRRIDEWFHVYYNSDEFQAFAECGVEPAFWSQVENSNPLDKAAFHEIPFYQRVWLLKSLCNYIMHNDKQIIDCFLKANTKELRPLFIAKDKRGSKYVRIPFFQEIRVYKLGTLSEGCLSSIHEEDFYDDFLSEYINFTCQLDFDENEKKLELSPSRKDCTLIADSLESLAAFTKTLKDQKRATLARNFTTQLKLVKNERRSIDGLIALHSQWHDYQNRTEEHFAHILTLWLSAEKQKRRGVDFLNPGLDNESKDEQVVQGKRNRKQKENMDYFSQFDDSDRSGEGQSSDYGDSDVSDWESTYKNRKKKKLMDHKKKRESNQSDPEDQQSNSALSISGVHSTFDEFFEEEKPKIMSLGNSSFIDMNDVAKKNSSSSPGVIPGSLPLSGVAPSAAAPKIKVEVISISSDEEEEGGTAPVAAATPQGGVLKVLQVNGGVGSSAAGAAASGSVRLANLLAGGGGSQQHQQGPVTVERQSVTRLQQPAGSTNHSVSFHRQPTVPSHQPQTTASTGELQHRFQGVTIQAVPAGRLQTPSKSVVPQPIQVPQPIPLPPSAAGLTNSTPKKSKFPLPIPEPVTPPQGRKRMPRPIPEPAWPQPMQDPRGTTTPGAGSWSPRGRGGSPRGVGLSSPRGGVSPRFTSPRTPSPRGGPLLSPTSRPSLPSQTPRSGIVRKIFPTSPSSSVPTVEGLLEIGQKPDGSYGYHVRLPDGGIINLSRQEIDNIRRKNNGALPVKMEVPLNRSRPF